MEKQCINKLVDKICVSDSDEDEKTELLEALWSELHEKRERKYFVNRVFKKLGYFPKNIYLVEKCIECCGDDPEKSFAQSILDASKRKNKEIE